MLFWVCPLWAPSSQTSGKSWRGMHRATDIYRGTGASSWTRYF